MPDTKNCTDCGRVMHIDTTADRCPECRQNFPHTRETFSHDEVMAHFGYSDADLDSVQEQPLCMVRCCGAHPDRHCQLPDGHDSDHDDGDGHQWLRIGWERKK